MNTSSKNRSKKLKTNILYMFVLKGFAMSVSFLYVPLLLNSLSSDSYAIWLTLTSMVSWIAMLDIGLGNGLRNKLSEALASNDYKLSRTYISTAYGCLSICALMLLSFYALVSPLISWTNVLNAASIPKNELYILVSIVFVAFVFNFFLGLINSILYSLQKPAISSFCAFINQLMSFLIVYILVTYFQVHSLLILGSVISLLPPISLLLFTIYVFYKNKNLSPSLRYFDKRVIKDILSLGLKFFILQIISIVLFQTNNLIIMHQVSNEAVIEYNVVYKYFNILVMCYGIIVAPIWSAVTEAYVKNDFDWIRSVVYKMQKIVYVFVFIGFSMVICSKFFYSLWLGQTGASNLNINWSLSLLMFIYTIFYLLYQTYGYIINGIGKLKIQLFITSLMALSYIPLCCIMGNIWGLNGVLCVFCLTSLVNFIWSKIQYDKLINRTAIGLWNQ